MSQSERRLAAIMFTDVVGYTALTQENESTTIGLLDDHRGLIRPIFASHGGREVKTIGDAFLVEFSSALDATLCAVAVQSAMNDRRLARGERLAVRIGIHVGDVIERENDVLGDAVNIASRIEPLAEPGGVCISGDVYAQVRNKLPYAMNQVAAPDLKNVTVPVDVYRIVMPWMRDDSKEVVELDRTRIAVLPFASMSPDPNDEYFADGLTEELIGKVSQVGGLEVIARTSVMNYKKKEKSVSQIGKELSVGTVMEGSVRKAGNRIRVAAQLINANTEGHLWSSTYDRDLEDIFAIQSDIANQIAEALKVKLAPGQGPAGKHPENIEAYTLYLKGRSLWNKRDKEGVLGSIKVFQESVKIDPGFARAYAGLADAYSIAAGSYVDIADGQAKSKEAAMKALELDDTLAEAHASLGINLLNDLRYGDAQREFRRAIELNPNYATAHQWYCLCLWEMGIMKEAKEEIEKARELDPLSPIIAIDVAGLTLEAGRLDDAIAVLDKLIETEPTFPWGYSNRCYCFTLKGMKEKAFADAETWHKLTGDEDGYKWLLALEYGWFGERARALPLIEELATKVGKSTIWEQGIAECYAVLGDKDGFFEWIDKAISAKRISVVIYRSSPEFDKVRDDPRFPEIFKKLGLPY